MMGVEWLLAAALSVGQAEPQAVPGGGAPVLHRRVATAVLDIPDELAPAVVPYMNCLHASLGVSVSNERGVVPPPPGISRGSDCADYRKRAQAYGEQLLRRLGVRSRDERAARVDATLRNMDDFVNANIRQVQPTLEEDAPDAPNP